jgi:hypothetical protein
LVINPWNKGGLKMRGKFVLAVLAMLMVGVGCVTAPLDTHVQEIVYEQGKIQKFTYKDNTYGQKGDSAAFMGAIDTLKQLDPLALPELEDLPMPGVQKKDVHAYTGIIKNTTKYDLSVPSANSGATLAVPAKGFIEYKAWTRHFNLTVYRDGKPFYCLKISAHPRGYAYMCEKYDFIAEIVKPEPVKKRKPVRKRRYKRAPRGEGVEGYG